MALKETFVPKPYVPYAGPVISKEDAKASGLNKWFSGKPCRHGHISQRLISSNVCCECRKHVKRKPEPLERVRERAAAWRDKNREKTRNYIREYMRENWERYAEKQKSWKSNNADRLKDYYKVSRSKRRAQLLNSGGSHNRNDIQRIGESQKWKCANCKCCVKEKYSVDHIKPIARGGTNWPKNLQILCNLCNSKKHAKDPLDFARQMGRLL